MKKEAGSDWAELRTQAMDLLQEEASLQEIVRLVGQESLSTKEQFVLDTAKSIREDFLQQNAYDEIDTYTSVKKLYLMLKVIMSFHQAGLKLIKDDSEIKIDSLTSHPLKETMAKLKMIPEDKLGEFNELLSQIDKLII